MTSCTLLVKKLSFASTCERFMLRKVMVYSFQTLVVGNNLIAYTYKLRKGNNLSLNQP